MRRNLPHLYFRDGVWHCRGAGQMITITSRYSAEAAYFRWQQYCRLLNSGATFSLVPGVARCIHHTDRPQ